MSDLKPIPAATAARAYTWSTTARHLVDVYTALTTSQLRQEIQQLRDRLDFAVNEKRARVKLLDVLVEITSLLPDDTWLLELEVRGDEVQMRGETPNAAQLVGLLESSKQLHNARFRSPVIQIAAAGRERFHLSVQLQQEGET